MFLPEKFRDQEGEEGRGIVDVDVQETYGVDDSKKPDREGSEIGNAEGWKKRDNMIGARRWQKERINAENEEAQKPIGGEKTKIEEEQKSEEGSKAEEKPLSRAERRKKIKEEILLAGEGEGFKGYKRRMW